MSNIVLAQATKLAESLGMSGEGSDLIATLKATAFKGQVTDSQMAALLIVANQYRLSPWTKEIYAFPDKNNGIVPVVGVDGWARIINEHAAFDGMDFQQDAESCTCIIYRKDRSHPIKVTEWMDECRRSTGPWQSHPKRMLRHKAMIQAARVAFGYGGIFDQDEAERIVESGRQTKAIDPATGEIVGFALADALAEVKAADTLDVLAEVWKRRGAEAVGARDKAGHTHLRDAVAARKADMERAQDENIIDAEPAAEVQE